MKPMNIHQAMKKYRWQYAIFPVLMFIHIILLASCAPAHALRGVGGTPL